MTDLRPRTARGPELDLYERDTVPLVFLHGLERYTDGPAMLYKEAGQWRPLSPAEVQSRVARMAAGLALLNVRKRDRVALLSENRPEWAITDYAALALGAVVVPVYPTLPAPQIAYILNDCQAKVICVSTREQLEKVMEIRAEVPSLELVVAFDPAGDARGVTRLEEVLELGRAEIKAGRAAPLREQALAVRADDLATLIYTSGTTGSPKGVMLSHHNLAYMVAATRQHGALPTRPGGVALSFLPLSHVLERAGSYYLWDSGVTIAYAESVNTVADDLQEVRPHYMISVPRLFEKIYAKVLSAGGVRGRLVRWAVGVGRSWSEAVERGETPAGPLALQHRLADRLVYSKLRARTGGRLERMISGGAPLAADIARFFFAAGIPVFEGYGLTETSPVLNANTREHFRFGTVGRPYPGVELRLGAEDEIQARTPGLMKGYWNQPDKTAEAIDEEGWFRTGDVGELTPDGFLRITDRIKDLIVTAGGKNIAPQPMENRIALSPYIAQAVIIGDRRPFPVVLVAPDPDALREWARGAGVADEPALLQDPRVRELLEREAFGALEDFARYERPKKLAVLPQELSIDQGTLTPTLKVRRRAVEQQYAALIESLYEGQDGA